ncbi:hypothetical protein HY227_01295 [Candidatus Wolfebacteria bacterium]|nr:hypothetical protein [Candidatus Wolfebacteria bacterium]
MENQIQIQKSSQRDVFMNLLGIAGLYVSVFNVLTLLFQYIDVAFPDKLNPYYDAGSPIRWSLASIIIIFPVFLWISRFLYRDLKNNPQKNELKIRKWLLYFTLFAAAILIIGDLVALIYNFLEGELTLRFILKILSILAVAVGVFGYYFYDLRRRPDEYAKKVKFSVWATIGIILVIIVYGFFVVGSPFKQRLIRFDNQKIGDLQTIQGQIVNYWIQKEKLPLSLNDLIDSISGFTPPKDSQTGEFYIYKKTDNLAFQLCAKFNLPSNNPLAEQRFEAKLVGAYGEQPDNWKHGAGEICFDRKIDPELYKPAIKR